MLYWVIYDISDNGKRGKVARICKNYGLRRVQKSSFLGETTRNRIEMLEIECKEVLEESDDYLFVLPYCESCFGGRKIIGTLDEKKIRDCGYAFIGGAT